MDDFDSDKFMVVFLNDMICVVFYENYFFFVFEVIW